MKIVTIIATNEPAKYIHYFKRNWLNLTSQIILVLDNVDIIPFELSNMRADEGLIVLHSPVKNNVYAARNKGIDFALNMGATHILFTDIDCVVQKGWENEMVKDGGHIWVGWTNEIASENQSLTDHGKSYPLGFGTNGIKFYCSGANVITTCNCGYHADVFKKLGVFPLDMSSDAKFGQLASQHFKVKYRMDAVVDHYIVETAYELFKKKMRYSKSIISSPWTAILWIIGSTIMNIGYAVKALSFKNLSWKALGRDLWYVYMQDIALGFGSIKQAFKKYKNIW